MYLFQAEDFATRRIFSEPTACARIVPLLQALGRNLELLGTIKGVEDRVARLMNAERAQPDAGLYELLVALSYRRYGWQEVLLIPETPGQGRTPDIAVAKPRRTWTIECKRFGRSAYGKLERDIAQRIAQQVHRRTRQSGHSVMLNVEFKVELDTLNEDHLIQYVDRFLREPTAFCWDTEDSAGEIRAMDFRPLRKVLRTDVVYNGSTRMFELLSGRYDRYAGHNMAIKARRWSKNPLYIDEISWASLVKWWSVSDESVERKARHFRSHLADANDQLSGDGPGCIHIGIDATQGDSVEVLRYLKNKREIERFNTCGSRLRWVYCNIFGPDSTPNLDEAWAFDETTIPFKVGRHATKEPLPEHMLILKDDTNVRMGTPWLNP